MDIIQTNKAPEAAGPYSQAIKTNQFVFLSGQLGINPDTGIMAESFSEQTEQAIANISAVLAETGLSLTDVAKTTCFLTDISEFPFFNAIYEKYFISYPARSCVEVSALPKGALVEIEVVAIAR
jgi:2-iminobutanoate/2-iminopropanoate deaminase